MTATELNALAARVVMDRLTGCKAVDAGGGRVRFVRMLAPTDAELRYEALLALNGCVRREPRETFAVHPAVVAVARAAKAARR